MEQPLDARILTINQVAEILQCSKAHVSNALNGKVANVPALPHFSRGFTADVIRCGSQQE
jgi:hypothetical protein